MWRRTLTLSTGAVIWTFGWVSHAIIYWNGSMRHSFLFHLTCHMDSCILTSELEVLFDGASVSTQYKFTIMLSGWHQFLLMALHSKDSKKRKSIFLRHTNTTLVHSSLIHRQSKEHQRIPIESCTNISHRQLVFVDRVRMMSQVDRRRFSALLTIQCRAWRRRIISRCGRCSRRSWDPALTRELDYKFIFSLQIDNQLHCRIPLAAGLFHRDVYLEGIKNRLNGNFPDHSSACVIQWNPQF